MKNYTDIEQSKKLAEILPLESADGFWGYHDKWYSEGDDWEGYEDYPRAEPYFEYARKENEWKKDKSDVPCWSLAALLSVLPNSIYDNTDEYSQLEFSKISVAYHDMNDRIKVGSIKDNLVDACYEMILKLHKLNNL